MNVVYVSTGSNMGDKLANCRNGISALARVSSIRLERVSKFYLTEPMYYSDQPWFVNAAIRIRTGLSPLDLLNVLKLLERDAGRLDNDRRFGPRILDFDIIFFNDWVVQSPGLVIPHPKMHQRGFVLHPMVDIAPDMIHPVLGKTVAQLLRGLKKDDQGCIRMETEMDSAVLTA